MGAATMATGGGGGGSSSSSSSSSSLGSGGGGGGGGGGGDDGGRGEGGEGVYGGELAEVDALAAAESDGGIVANSLPQTAAVPLLPAEVEIASAPTEERGGGGGDCKGAPARMPAVHDTALAESPSPSPAAPAAAAADYRSATDAFKKSLEADPKDANKVQASLDRVEAEFQAATMALAHAHAERRQAEEVAAPSAAPAAAAAAVVLAQSAVAVPKPAAGARAGCGCLLAAMAIAATAGSGLAIWGCLQTEEGRAKLERLQLRRLAEGTFQAVQERSMKA